MHQRTARVEEAASDGTFTMTLATEGEASDGDILSIKGGQIPDRMPLLLSHWNEPTATAGSVTQPRKFLGDDPARLRAVGQIELEGEGDLADVRRDVFLMLTRGHLDSVSIRWDSVSGGKQPTRRVNLPSDHFAHVKDDDPDMRKRFGMFWHEWRALEGSIVAVGADPEAKAFRARAEETSGMLRTFWRAMAEDVECSGEASVAATLLDLQVLARDCKQQGATNADVINAVAGEANIEDFEVVKLGGRTFFVPSPVADQLREAEEALDQEPVLETVEALDPEPIEEPPDQASPLELDLEQIRNPFDVEEIGRMMAEKLEASEQRLQRNVQALLDLATGKV